MSHLFNKNHIKIQYGQSFYNAKNDNSEMHLFYQLLFQVRLHIGVIIKKNCQLRNLINSIHKLNQLERAMKG